MSKAESSIINIHKKRKADHIDISLNREVSFNGVSTGFEDYRFAHQALPEIDLQEVDLTTEILGRPAGSPVLISSMVGGIEEGARLNRNLAEAAQHHRVAMGVGSQRCAIEDPRLEWTFRVRDIAPDIPLYANLGAVQLNYGYGVEECIRAVEMIEADALILHLNPLQEALQYEGNTRFADLAKKIEVVCRALPVPVIAKEVSFGISRETSRMLNNTGVAALDVAGAGGTSWGEVEKYRSVSETGFNIAGSFSEWGIPTAESIRLVREEDRNIFLIASGGIRTGIDLAKAVALGADFGGIALPLMCAASESAEAVSNALTEIIDELRITMFCVGAVNIEALQYTSRLNKK